MTFLEHPLWRHLEPYAVEFGDRTFFVDVPAQLFMLALAHAISNCAKCGRAINPLVPEADGTIIYVPVCCTTVIDEVASGCAADEAIEAVGAGADRAWLIEARAVVLEVAGSLDEFSTDDVWKMGLQKPREPRALGYVMRELARGGFIELTGNHHRTAQALRHRAPVMLWRRRSLKVA